MNLVKLFQKSLVDLIFPPLCLYCNEPTDLKYLCERCWTQSPVVDLENRCRHCFDDCEDGVLCSRCSHKPLLPFERAFVFDRSSPIAQILSEEMSEAAAGFAFYQWAKLGWDEPDLIAAISPGKNEVAKQFSKLMNKPCPDLFRTIAWPLGSQRLEIYDHFLEEDSTILFFDEGFTTKQLQMAGASLSHAFPKKVYCLSLFS